MFNRRGTVSSGRLDSERVQTIRSVNCIYIVGLIQRTLEYVTIDARVGFPSISEHIFHQLSGLGELKISTVDYYSINGTRNLYFGIVDVKLKLRLKKVEVCIPLVWFGVYSAQCCCVQGLCAEYKAVLVNTALNFGKLLLPYEFKDENKLYIKSPP